MTQYLKKTCGLDDYFIAIPKLGHLPIFYRLTKQAMCYLKKTPDPTEFKFIDIEEKNKKLS
jgi:hypothetical protein